MEFGGIGMYHKDYVDMLIKQRNKNFEDLVKAEDNCQKMSDKYDELNHEFLMYKAIDNNYEKGKHVGYEEGYNDGYKAGKQSLKEDICNFLEIRQADDDDVNYD